MAAYMDRRALIGVAGIFVHEQLKRSVHMEMIESGVGTVIRLDEGDHIVLVHGVAIVTAVRIVEEGDLDEGTYDVTASQVEIE